MGVFMKNIGRAFLLVFLLFVFAFSFSLLGFAEEKVAEGTLGDTAIFEIYNSGSEEKPIYTLRISGSGSFIGMDMSGNALKYKTKNESVLSPYAQSIVRAEIGEGIEEIGDYGLAFLKALREVYIPSTVRSIGSAAFQDCHYLTKIVLAGEEDAPGFNLINITTIKGYAFSGCRSVRSIMLSEELSGPLGKQCFAECRMLRFLNVPEGVGAIGAECFKNCTALHYIEVLGEPTIDSTALLGADSAYIIAGKGGAAYTEIIEKALPYGGESIRELPFAPADSAVDFGTAGKALYWQIVENEGSTKEEPLYDLVISGAGKEVNITDIFGKSMNTKNYKNSQWAPYINRIVNVRIEADVETLGVGSFLGLRAMKTIEIPYSLSVFSGVVFEYCENLSSIYLSGNEPKEGVFDLSGIKSFGAYCFDGCRYLTTPILSEELSQETIGAETFKNCKGLTSFTVPAVITKIEKNAFLGCENLSEVIFELDASIDKRAFNNCKALRTMRGLSDSKAEKFALDNGIEFLYPCRVAIRAVGTKKLIENVDVIAGQSLKNFVADGKVCLMYTDPEGKDVYTMTPIDRTTTLYVKPIYGISEIRIKYQEGLKLGVDLSLAENIENSAFKLVEAGAIASRDRGTSEAEIGLNMSRIYSTVFYENGKLQGGISLPGDREGFGFFACGFEGEEGEPLSERCFEKLYFRGYLVIQDKNSGEKYTFYTDMKGSSIYEEAKKVSRGEAGAYSLSEVEYMSTLPELCGAERRPRNAKELLSLVEQIEMGEHPILFSGEPAINDADFFDVYLAEQYEKNGSIPAMMRFDVTDIFDIGLGNEKVLRALAKDIAQYSEFGGSVMLYLRPGNPSSNASTGGKLSSQEWEYTFSDPSPYRNALLSELGKTGMLLQFLKEEGVTVFVNLLPEINSEKVWWCASAFEGDSQEDRISRYTRLFKECSEYLYEECSLDNIIFVFEGGDSGNDYFPGKDHADVSGTAFESSKGSFVLK